MVAIPDSEEDRPGHRQGVFFPLARGTLRSVTPVQVHSPQMGNAIMNKPARREEETRDREKHYSNNASYKINQRQQRGV
jgi:hypothetical protein